MVVLVEFCIVTPSAESGPFSPIPAFFPKHLCAPLLSPLILLLHSQETPFNPHPARKLGGRLTLSHFLRPWRLDLKVKGGGKMSLPHHLR